MAKLMDLAAYPELVMRVAHHTAAMVGALRAGAPQVQDMPIMMLLILVKEELEY
jgi:hypothetical protein